MLIWIKWLEKRAIRIEIRWEETNPEIGERERERDNLVEKCQRERILWKVGSTNIRIVESTAVHMRRTDSTHIFLSFFLTRHAHAPFWHCRPTFFFFFIQLFATKAFCSFQKRSSKMQFLCSRKSEYISFVLLYLSARIFLKFYAFFLTVYMHISSSFLLRGYLNGKEILYYCSDQFHK